jgi:hypothetical protein
MSPPPSTSLFTNIINIFQKPSSSNLTLQQQQQGKTEWFIQKFINQLENLKRKYQDYVEKIVVDCFYRDLEAYQKRRWLLFCFVLFCFVLFCFVLFCF